MFPQSSLDEIADALGGPLPSRPHGPARGRRVDGARDRARCRRDRGAAVLRLRDRRCAPGDRRADWLTTIWDQCAGLGALGPSASVVEVIVGDWLKDVFGLPADASFAVTTGCQMAHVTALAAARHHVLAARDWDVRERGLAGSPPITWWSDNFATSPSTGRCDSSGSAVRSSWSSLRTRRAHAARCAAARACDARRPDDRVRAGRRGEHGLVRPAARDRRDRARDRRMAPRGRRVRPVGGREPGAASPRRRREWRRLVGDGRAQVAERPVRLRSRLLRAPVRPSGVDDDAGLVLRGSGQVGPRRIRRTPESSRRARAFTVYAALRSLGRDGVAELVERCCQLARSSRKGSRGFRAASC